MAHDASNNNPTKEIVHALIGIVLLLTMIAGIAISAWLRPAGNHEVATVPATEAGKVLEEKFHNVGGGSNSGGFGSGGFSGGGGGGFSGGGFGGGGGGSW